METHEQRGSQTASIFGGKVNGASGSHPACWAQNAYQLWILRTSYCFLGLKVSNTPGIFIGVFTTNDYMWHWTVSLFLWREIVARISQGGAMNPLWRHRPDRALWNQYSLQRWSYTKVGPCVNTRIKSMRMVTGPWSYWFYWLALVDNRRTNSTIARDTNTNCDQDP